MVGDIDTTVGERDIIAEKKPNENERGIIMEKSEKNLERISSVHPSLMALQYPILFPFGEDGYHDEIPYVDSETQTKKKRKRITMKEYTPIDYRSEKMKTNLRSDLYNTLAKKVVNGGTDATNVAPSKPGSEVWGPQHNTIYQPE
ncbi:hypothetical protein AgCh_030009 [Apium graveolens]